jgi:hypothetical protein
VAKIETTSVKVGVDDTAAWVYFLASIGVFMSASNHVGFWHSLGIALFWPVWVGQHFAEMMFR